MELMEIKYEIHECLDIKEIIEEPANYQQSRIKIENDMYSSYLDNNGLDHSQHCSEYEYDKETEIKSPVMLIQDEPSNLVPHMKKRKTETNDKHKRENFKNIMNYDVEGT